MDQRPDGRYCHSCQKTVIDFSNKSDREVTAYFQKIDGQVCGKFRQDQLRRPVHFEQPRTFGGRLRALGLLVPGLLAGAVANGQATEPHPTELHENIFGESLRGYVTIPPLRKVRGVVKDSETGEPLIGVSVLLKDTQKGTITNLDGSYELDIPISIVDTSTTLQFSYTGFHTQEVVVENNDRLLENVMMEVNMEMYYSGAVGEIVITRDQTLYNIVKNKIQNLSYNIRSYLKEKRKEKAAKKLIEKKEENNIEIQENKSEQIIKKENNYAGKIFPNPFSQQINIQINCPKNEPLNIRLLDLNGSIIFSQKYDAVKGDNKISISPNIQNMAAANYMLEITGAGGLYLAEMVVYSNGN